RGANTNAGFLTALYGDVLNRSIDSVGASAWGGILDSGHTPDGSDPRTFVARGVVTSTEGSKDAVQAFYARFLHRAADPGGLMGWAGLIENGTGSGVVIVGIVASDEYFQRAVSTTSAPAIVILSPANDGIATENITITGQVSLDRSLVAALVAVVDNGVPSNVPYDAVGSFSFR